MRRFFGAAFYPQSSATNGNLQPPSSGSLAATESAGNCSKFPETEAHHSETVETEASVDAHAQAKSDCNELEAAKLEVSRLTEVEAQMQAKIHLLQKELEMMEAHHSETVDAAGSVEAHAQAKSLCSELEAARLEVARLTDVEAQMQTKIHLLQKELQTMEVHHSETVDAAGSVEAHAQAKSLCNELEAAKLEVARLTDVESEMQTKIQLLQRELRAMEARAIRAEGISLRCHEEFFVFQTKAVQQIKHLQDVIRTSHRASEANQAEKKQALLDQSLIETLREEIQKQELEREEEKQALLEEMWELQQLAQSLQAKQEVDEIPRKSKEVLKVPLVDDRKLTAGNQDATSGWRSPGWKSPVSIDSAAPAGIRQSRTGCRSPVVLVPSRPRSPMSVSSQTNVDEAAGDILSILSRRFKDIDEATIVNQLQKHNGHAGRTAQALRRLSNLA